MLEQYSKSAFPVNSMSGENHAEVASTSEATEESSESTVELNIKTLDSQIYKFRVDKNMPVPLFKEKIANAVGVPVGQQRLIFRGKVLKDDHLLSEYHVGDGHTLHLVARQPAQSQPSSGTSIGEADGNNDSRANDVSAGAPRNRVGQISHSVVLGTFNVGDQGEGAVPDLSRIFGAVLNSLSQTTAGGTSSVSRTIPANAFGQASQGMETEEIHNNVGSRSQAGNRVQPGQAIPNHRFQSLPQALQFPLTGAAVPLPSLHMPIPDSLNTLSEFMNRMELALSLNGYQPNSSPVNVGDPPRVDLPSNVLGQPTPEALSIIMRRAQQILSGHAVAALSVHPILLSFTFIHIEYRHSIVMARLADSELQTESFQEHAAPSVSPCPVRGGIVRGEAVSFGGPAVSSSTCDNVGEHETRGGGEQQRLKPDGGEGEGEKQTQISGKSYLFDHIAGRLEGEGSSTDPAVRGQIQTESVQVGLAMQHLGALFLELGRTILTLRMGHSPAESLVNAGPAVYISPAGPNPIMVQPFPLQTSSLFGSASAAPQANPGVVGPIRLGDVPRHINIHIHAVGSAANTGEGTQAEHPNGTGSGDSVPTQALPVRNAIAAAIQSRSAAEAAGNVLSALYPLQERSQQTNPINSAHTQESSIAQPGIGVSVPQPTSGPVSLSTAIAEVGSRLRNLIVDMQGEIQAPSAQSEALTVQDSSIGSGMGTDVGNHQPKSMAVDGVGETNVSVPDGVSEREEQQHQPECCQYSINEESSGILSSKEASSTYSVRGSLSSPTRETTLPHDSEVASEGTSGSSQSHDSLDGTKAIPLGLGLGGLQPRRRSRQVKSQGKDGDGTSGASVNQNKQTIANGQQVSQSPASRGSIAYRMDANGSPSGQLSPVLGQIMETMPLEGQGSTGQFEVSSMMSQVLNSPALNGLLAGVSEQAGVGSPAVLRNMLEQVTQSSSMRNTINQIAQQMEGQDLGNMFSGLGGGQGGGLDLSRMLQQMMPIVSQALTRGATHPELFSGVEPNTQAHCNERRPGRDNQLDQNYQIGLQQAAQRIEHRDPPRDIFRTMVEIATRLYGHGINSEDLVEELCSNEDLANGFMEILDRDIRCRLQEDSGSTDKS
ncbi:hypothetical protein HHK36_031130 [Tetracentron sinense]|uniref:Ubiquitin-like domain-containing protein n=1 Tax=Tetracentron sinense TaxID=13715 RepID=A0A834YE92_TETSI|nr:hypothetical protein HHK36_031130 [Tetracentron sinense]